MSYIDEAEAAILNALYDRPLQAATAREAAEAAEPAIADHARKEAEAELREAKNYADECEAAVGRETDPLVAQREALKAQMRRIRAAAESDTDLAKLPALRDFLLTETRAVEFPDTIIGLTPEDQARNSERSKVEAALLSEEAESQGVLEDSRYTDKDHEQAKGSLAACRAVRHAALKASTADEGSFYLCFNCGTVAAEAGWTYWQREEDGDGYRPSRDDESDPLMKCPTCQELHGDCYVGSGVEDGTKAECEAERARMLADDPDYAAEWSAVLTQPQQDDQEEQR